MIPAGCTELRKAFLGHIRVGHTGEEDSHRLLIFYGLECGLKSVYLRNNRLNRTDRIRDERLRRTHDLFLLVKELKLPAQIAGSNAPSFRLKRDGDTFDIRHAHEAWRYGIEMRTADAGALDGWMQKINQWVKERI